MGPQTVQHARQYSTITAICEAKPLHQRRLGNSNVAFGCCVCVLWYGLCLRGRMSPHKERVEAMTLLGVAGMCGCMQAGLFSPPATPTHARTPSSLSFLFALSLPSSLSVSPDLVLARHCVAELERNSI